MFFLNMGHLIGRFEIFKGNLWWVLLMDLIALYYIITLLFCKRIKISSGYITVYFPIFFKKIIIEFSHLENIKIISRRYLKFGPIFEYIILYHDKKKKIRITNFQIKHFRRLINYISINSYGKPKEQIELFDKENKYFYEDIDNFAFKATITFSKVLIVILLYMIFIA